MLCRTKSIITLLVFSFVFSSVSAVAAPFPLNFDLDSLQIAERTPSAFDDKLIAFAGTVTDLKSAYQGKPYFFVKFHNPNPKNQGIWVASLVTPEPENLRVGHQVAVLGYFSGIDSSESLARSIHKKSYHVLGICLVNVTTKVGSYSPAGKNQCSEWQSGIIPESKSSAPDSAKRKGP